MTRGFERELHKPSPGILEHSSPLCHSSHAVDLETHSEYRLKKEFYRTVANAHLGLFLRVRYIFFPPSSHRSALGGR